MLTVNKPVAIASTPDLIFCLKSKQIPVRNQEFPYTHMTACLDYWVVESDTVKGREWLRTHLDFNPARATPTTCPYGKAGELASSASRDGCQVRICFSESER
jgi:hypothetical protein